MLFFFCLYAKMTVFINLIPFIKLDGYWIVVDLLGYPNLYRETCKRMLGLFRKQTGEKPKVAYSAAKNAYFIGFCMFLIIFGFYLFYDYIKLIVILVEEADENYYQLRKVWSVIKVFFMTIFYRQIIKVIIREAKGGVAIE